MTRNQQTLTVCHFGFLILTPDAATIMKVVCIFQFDIAILCI